MTKQGRAEARARMADALYAASEPLPLSTADFREHIASLCGIKPLSPDAKRSHPCLVRKPTDRGYHP